MDKSSRMSPFLASVVTLAAVVILGLVASVVFLFFRDSDHNSDTATPKLSTPVSSTPSSVPSSSPTVVPSAVPPAPDNPYGTVTHKCLDLWNMNWPYNKVNEYWHWLGSPADMDDDHDGWPCETIYGQQPGGDPYGGVTTHDCSVLAGMGWNYQKVYGYWAWIGRPGDMDNDHDGWPCETVYGDMN